MSKWKTVGTKLTEEDYSKLLRCLEKVNKEKGSSFNINSLLISIIKYSKIKWRKGV